MFAAACALLVVAGVYKVRDPAAAAGSVARLGLSVPAPAIRALGASEIVLGAAALIRPVAFSAALVAFAYGTFAVFVALLLRADGPADCGCFGGAGESVGITHLILNAAACAVAALAAASPPGGLGWILSRAPLVSISLILGVGGATFALYAVFTMFQSAWRSYGAS